MQLRPRIKGLYDLSGLPNAGSSGTLKTKAQQYSFFGKTVFP